MGGYVAKKHTLFLSFLLCVFMWWMTVINDVKKRKEWPDTCPHGSWKCDACDDGPLFLSSRGLESIPCTCCYCQILIDWAQAKESLRSNFVIKFAFFTQRLNELFMRGKKERKKVHNEGCTRRPETNAWRRISHWSLQLFHFLLNFFLFVLSKKKVEGGAVGLVLGDVRRRR